MQLATRRLSIRSFTESDVDAYAAIVADPAVTRYLGTGEAHSYETARRYVLDEIERDQATGIARYAVEYRTDFIGFCGFRTMEDHTDFGWRYARQTWGQGIGTEAAFAVFAFGTDELCLDDISAGAFAANEASLSIIRKLDFVRSEEMEVLGRPAIRYYQV